MIHFSICGPLLRRHAAAFAGLIAVLVVVSAAHALDLDFNVASGNYNVASNWIDTTNPIPVASAAPPTVADSAYVRNNGTVTINSNVEASRLWVGYTRVITNPDYNDDGVVDAADYVLWRKGGPIFNDATPADVGPDDYTLWRFRFGASPTDENIGLAGTLIWTAGEITGPASAGSNLGGPDIRIGRHQVVNSVIVEVPGTVIQNGPTTKVLLPYGDNSGNMTTGHGSVLTIGDAGTGGFSNAPISSYTLMDGTIGVGVSGPTGSTGTNGNNGIWVRNGTFTMTGGNIIDATQAIFAANPNAQRFLTIASQAGGGVDNESVSTANLRGGNINVLGGIRMANANNTRGYLNINENSGPMTIVTGGDTQIGSSGTNSVGVMTMSAGTFQVGRNDPNPNNGGAPYTITGRFMVGDSSVGMLNMSGGSINATRNVVVGNNQTSIGSSITMTGGTISTPGIEMRRNSGISDSLPAEEYAAKIIVDGPTASFITTGQSGTNLSPGVIIGNYGKALFEVRQGSAVLGGGGSVISVGHSPGSQATINVKGGKLTLGGIVTRTVNPTVEPVFGLTGGILEFNNTTTPLAQSFLADLNNQGTQLITKPNALLQVTVGRRENLPTTFGVPSKFEMTSGSWNIDIDSTIVNTLGADWFNAPAGAASLTGGTLNINYLSGTPTDGQLFRILRGGLGTTLGSLGSVTITGAGAGHWTLVEAPIVTAGWPLDEEIQLKYSTALVPGSGAGLGSAIPEPSSLALLGFVFAGWLTRRSRCWTAA